MSVKAKMWTRYKNIMFNDHIGHDENCEVAKFHTSNLIKHMSKTLHYAVTVEW